MALHGEYYDLIWQGLKTHEFRRRFLEGRGVRWFVYLNAPISRLAPVIDLAPAVVGSPEEIARIAERMRPGNGASVMSYVQDLERAYALPILSVTEYPGLSTEDLRAELGAFHPPQGYIRLTNHPELLAVCARIAADAPIRSITVDHRLYRVRRGCRADPGEWLPWLTARRAPPVDGLSAAQAERSLELDPDPGREGDRSSYARRAFGSDTEHVVRLGGHVTSIGHRATLCARSSGARPRLP